MQVTETLSQGLKREYDIVLAGERSRRAARTRSSPTSRQGADQRLPSRQGAGRASQARLRQVGDGRCRPGGDQRRQQADRRRQQPAPRREPQGRSARRPGRDRGGARGARRPRLQGRVRGAADIRGRRLRRHRARAAGRRRRGERGRDARSQRLAEDRARLRRQAARAPRRRPSIASPSTSSARSTASRSRAARASDIEVVLGSNTFIPGFEEQLLGAAAGDSASVQATFPEAYAACASSPARQAEFDVTVKAVAAPEPLAIDDEFAKSSASKASTQLKECGARPHRRRLRARLARQGQAQAARRARRRAIRSNCREGLVEQEFAAIWAQVEREQQASGRSFADENTTEEAARAEYRRIAERRVRLGLLLAEVGAKAGRQDQRRGDDPGADRARPRLPRPGEAGLGLLPQQSAGAGRAARADLRGEGRRPHPRPRQGRGPQGDDGGTAASRDDEPVRRPRRRLRRAPTSAEPSVRPRARRERASFTTAPGAYLTGLRRRPIPLEARAHARSGRLLSPTTSCRSSSSSRRAASGRSTSSRACCASASSS